MCELDQLTVGGEWCETGWRTIDQDHYGLEHNSHDDRCVIIEHEPESFPTIPTIENHGK